MSTIQKAFKSLTLGGVIGTLALYALNHFDPSALGTWGVLLGPVIAAVTTAIAHHFQTNSSAQ